MQVVAIFMALFMSFALANQSNEFMMSSDDLKWVGEKIYLNETGGNEHYIVAWNDRENFASLGLGHFIWFPENLNSPFTESFPDLLNYMQDQNVTLPSWLTTRSDAPWSNRNAFIEAKSRQDKKLQDLKELLLTSFDHQVRFILQRKQNALPLMLGKLQTKSEKLKIKSLYDQLSSTKLGTYSLIDYVNFKGEGISESERYKGQGWGLLQVLQNINHGEDDLHIEFTKACKKVLKNRVDNSPNKDRERAWLKGWYKRCDTYSVK